MKKIIGPSVQASGTMSSFDVAAILSHDLSSLDEDVREYLVSVVEGMSPDERKSSVSLNEAIGPFLVDGGAVESEDAAELLCKTISISFGGSGFKSAVIAEEETVSLLSAPIKMIDRSGLNKTAKPTYGGTVISTFDEDGQLLEVNHNSSLDASAIATTQRQVRKNRKENERLNRILRAEELARFNAEAEMSAARMAAIKANRTAGRQAAMGVNIERFSIPHPSGTSDLLTDASLTLASNHRYGMVGKNGAGKSTLMRQLANYKLDGLMHLRILLVDQHVEGDDQSALQWVLRADVERTALLEDEQRLIACQHGNADLSTLPKDLQVSHGLLSILCFCPDDVWLNGKIEALFTNVIYRFFHPMLIYPSYFVSCQGVNLELALAEVYERMEVIGANTAEFRARKILTGLGFTDSMMVNPTGGLSGGMYVYLHVYILN